VEQLFIKTIVDGVSGELSINLSAGNVETSHTPYNNLVGRNNSFQAKKANKLEMGLFHINEGVMTLLYLKQDGLLYQFSSAQQLSRSCTLLSCKKTFWHTSLPNYEIFFV